MNRRAKKMETTDENQKSFSCLHFSAFKRGARLCGPRAAAAQPEVLAHWNLSRAAAGLRHSRAPFRGSRRQEIFAAQLTASPRGSSFDSIMGHTRVTVIGLVTEAGQYLPPWFSLVTG